MIKDKTKFPVLYILDDYNKSVNYPNHNKAEDDCKYVYLFRNKYSGLCKIGITNSPKTRLRQIQNTSGMEIQDLIILECLPEYDESPIFIEKFLHNYFGEKRKFGEWFQLSIREILSIRRLFWEIEGEYIFDNIKNYLAK